MKKLKQSEIWVTKYNTRIPIKQLEDDHLVNAALMVKKLQKLIPKYKYLCKEIRRRKLFLGYGPRPKERF